MANNVGRFSIPLRLSKNDKILLKYKRLVEESNMEVSSVVKYVLACNLLNVQPLCIAKVCINNFQADYIDQMSIAISEYDYDGMLYDWLIKQKEEKKEKRGIKVSTYLKRIMTSAIELCNTPEDQCVTDIYLDSINLFTRASHQNDGQTFQVNGYDRSIQNYSTIPVIEKPIQPNEITKEDSTNVSQNNSFISIPHQPTNNKTSIESSNPETTLEEEASSEDNNWNTMFNGLLSNSLKRG